MRVVDVPAPVPAEGEVLVTVEAAGVSGVDALIRSGHIPGSEFVGKVVAAGEGVGESWIGRRVGGFLGLGGGYAEQVTAPADELLPIPEELSAIEAAALGNAALVAHFGLRRAQFTPGESVLVRGAAGSLGTMTVQLAARGEDAPAGYDVIIDIVGGPDVTLFFDRLNPGGRIVVVGMIAGLPEPDFGAKMLRSFQKSMSFSTFSASIVPLADLRAVVAEQFTAVARGQLQVETHDVLPLEQAALAHQKMDAGEVFGRIVLTL